VKSRACIIAPVIVLTAALSSARGQILEEYVLQAPWWLRVVTQAPLTMPLSGESEVRPFAIAEYPSSGILAAPPPAPVAVPSSGVLQPPTDQQTIALPVAPLPPTAETPAATSMTGHLRPAVERGAQSQKRQHLARGVASGRVMAARERKETRIFAVASDRQAPVLHSRW
jgi:hypothetical protein